MKKIKIIFIMFVIFIMPIVVNAKSAKYDCEYGDGLSVTFGESGVTDVYHDPSSKTYPDYFGDNFFTNYITYNKEDYKLNKHLSNQLIELYGFCPSKLYYCTLEVVTFNPGPIEELVDIIEDGPTVENITSFLLGRPTYEVDLYALATQKEAENISKLSEYETGVTGGLNYFTHVSNALKYAKEEKWDKVLAEYTEYLKDAFTGEIGEISASSKTCQILEYKGNRSTYNLACPNIGVFYLRYSNSLQKYLSCGNDINCKVESMTSMNETEEQAKKYCNSILDVADYDEDLEQECLETCISISEKFIQIKEQAGLISTRDMKCGVSKRLLVWVSNILRWAKYILPVIVIILSILEFIKSMSADKDDEIKKAQKKFITRLISAALVFIIPLIIEFVLAKMGFGYDACGLF